MIFKTIALTTTSFLSLVMLMPTGAIAQINTAPTLSEQTLRETQQQERGSLGIAGSNVSLLQLINNINLAGGKTPEKFRADQAESFDEAVSNFRNQQRREVKFTIPANTP